MWMTPAIALSIVELVLVSGRSKATGLIEANSKKKGRAVGRGLPSFRHDGPRLDTAVADVNTA
jgi:hypothetical protein